MSTQALSSSLIALHVFSGVHLGARIELTEGEWTFGSSDECDIILTGLAPHHARVKVVSEEGGPQVFITPGDGEVTLQDTRITAESPLPKEEACYFGETCLAWNLPGAALAHIVPRSPLAAADTEVSLQPDEAESVAEEAATAEAEESVGEELNADVASAPLEQLKAPPPKKSFLERLFRPLPLVFLALLLGAISFTLSDPFSEPDKVETVLTTLSAQQITGLIVSEQSPGVLVSGTVRTAEELDRASRAVEKLSFPVYLSVTVDDDLFRAVQNTLGLQGFFPVVSMDRSGPEPKLVIACYMRDQVIEAAAFADLELDVASPPEKVRRIVHQQELMPLITAALNSMGLSELMPLYLPGRIIFTGKVSPEVAPLLAKLKADLSRRVGVPLFGEGFRVTDRNGVSGVPTSDHSLRVTNQELPGPRQGSSPDKTVVDPLGGLKVQGVFQAPIAFITTEDGQLFFEGSELPNGALLEAISPQALMIRLGGRLLTYSLRGKNND